MGIVLSRGRDGKLSSRRVDDNPKSIDDNADSSEDTLKTKPKGEDANFLCEKARKLTDQGKLFEAEAVYSGIVDWRGVDELDYGHYLLNRGLNYDGMAKSKLGIMGDLQSDFARYYLHEALTFLPNEGHIPLALASLEKGRNQPKMASFWLKQAEILASENPDIEVYGVKIKEYLARVENKR